MGVASKFDTITGVIGRLWLRAFLKAARSAGLMRFKYQAKPGGAWPVSANWAKSATATERSNSPKRTWSRRAAWAGWIQASKPIIKAVGMRRIIA